METERTRPMFPWYKERLETKYLKAPANKISLVGSCCRFVNMRLDDFSDCSSDLSRNQRGVSSVIFQRDTSNHNSSQKHIKGLSKEHTSFSKQMIQKQIRRDYVAPVEEKLKQNPLAMFPHYRDHMTPELFDKVVSVLDPDIGEYSASALPTPTGDHAEDEGRTGKLYQLSKHKDMKAATTIFSRWFASPDEETNITESAVH
ncbi:Protein FAM47A [Dissostichus eleginoides]|uniref:Protein FAM47A n=1 Tax=Dissostichus eleginoides TaxID=100907 RepID=A0AAD9C217_DISEL|nr:Protein FAM47A [Dissostichus eleginoides]